MLKNQIESSDELSVHTVTDDATYLEYFSSGQGGIGLVPEPYGNTSLGLKADGADFAKWLKQQRPELPISLPISSPRITLHSVDVWLPLIYLSSDVAMPVLLNLVSNYLYDKLKGKLPQDRPKVHLSVMYQNKRDGTTKRFEFSGDDDSLSKAIKRFDLDNFFDETTQ
ncbi:hypothetical protein [Burkholderia glumae]|uniref:hypothetical protein n=1 Tax=Burkholderia glumae TaxID=337 RepID=UPI00137446AD|nr:hypothetical protein [Burkholderia glumae]MCR1770876.1 hypothetical protein [Burkholderia glumae]QHP91590.1 hypothetical protein EXE55_12000 [Burkholderia glumae]